MNTNRVPGAVNPMLINANSLPDMQQEAKKGTINPAFIMNLKH